MGEEGGQPLGQSMGTVTTISEDWKFPESLGYASAVGGVTKSRSMQQGRQTWPAAATPLRTSERLQTSESSCVCRGIVGDSTTPGSLEGTDRSRFKANDRGLWNAFRLGLKGTRRQGYPEIRIKPTSPSHIWLQKDAPSARPRRETKPSNMQAKGEAVEREGRRWPGLGLLMRDFPIQGTSEDVWDLERPHFREKISLPLSHQTTQGTSSTSPNT